MIVDLIAASLFPSGKKCIQERFLKAFKRSIQAFKPYKHWKNCKIIRNKRLQSKINGKPTRQGNLSLKHADSNNNPLALKINIYKFITLGFVQIAMCNPDVF